MLNKTQLWLSALAAVAVFVLGSPAQAKIWVAQYDPPAFVGTGTFDVPDACLASDGPHQQGDFVGCAIQIMSNISTVPVVDFAAILSQSLCGGCEYEVLGGKFAGVNTGVIGPVNVGGTDYWFEFLSTFIGGETPSVTNFVNLYDDCFEGCAPPVNQATQVTFTPEPGSLALIVGALGAGWLVRRRKAAA